MFRVLADPVGRLVLLAALLLRIAFGLEVALQDLDLTKNDQLDMIYLHANAQEIARGDVLLERPFLGHYTDIREKIYGPARFDRLFKPETYTDSPGYLYFAALCEKLGGGSPYAVIWAQLLLDTVTCALVYAIALRAGGRVTALLALALAAPCLESVAHAGFVLRESFIAFLATLFLHALGRAEDAKTPRAWLLAGIAFGAGWVTKLTFSLALPFVALAAWRAGERRKALASVLGAFALGALLPVLPFAARNVRLGVAPLQMSSVSLCGIVSRNMVGYSGAAEHLDHATTHRILETADDTHLGAFIAAVRSHPSFGDYLTQVGHKAEFFFMAVDFWNEIRSRLLQELSPVLGACVVWWGVLAPWALLGAILGLRDRKLTATMGLFLSVGLGAALLGGVYTRYRLVVEPAACVLAASAMTAAARRIRRGHVAGFAIVLVAVGLRWVLRDPQPPLPKAYIQDYIVHTWPSERARTYLLARAERSGAP